MLGCNRIVLHCVVNCEEAIQRDGLCDERKHPEHLASSLLRGNNHRLLDGSQTILHRSDRPLDRPGVVGTQVGSDGMSKTARFSHLRPAGRRPGRCQYRVWHQPEDGCLERERVNKLHTVLHTSRNVWPLRQHPNQSESEAGKYSFELNALAKHDRPFTDYVLL